ncbi:MAG: phage/plasmid primase, P4 family [Nocardioidaceae bacterium]
MENGLLDLSSGELLPHSPDHLCTVQLPVRHDPDATCPHIDQFVRDTFPEDAFDLAYELLALVMVPDPSIQKAVLLLGPGGNGKSVWLRVMQRFLGPDNYSTVPLQRLEAERFSASRLQGMLANICADLPATDLKSSSVFKGITGGDRITAERKYHDSYDLYPFCKLIFSANTAPRTPDASDAFFQRWIVVPFDRTFRGEVTEIPSRELDARLHDQRNCRVC